MAGVHIRSNPAETRRCLQRPSRLSTRHGQPGDRQRGFPEQQRSPSSEDGPTQRARGSCGPRRFLMFWLKKALVPAFPDERVHSEETEALKALQSGRSHGLYRGRWNKQWVCIRNQEGKQLATEDQPPARGPHPGSKPHTGGGGRASLSFKSPPTHPSRQGRGRLPWVVNKAFSKAALHP